MLLASRFLFLFSDQKRAVDMNKSKDMPHLNLEQLSGIFETLLTNDSTADALFSDIYQLLDASNEIEAQIKLNLRASAFALCKKKGYITDEVYVALARLGFDIRKLLPKEKPLPIRKKIARILKVSDTYKDIAKALDITVEDVRECEFEGYLTDTVLIAFARKGFDIRKFWRGIPQSE